MTARISGPGGQIDFSEAPYHLIEDHGTRTDDQPVYLGKADAEAPFDVPTWKIFKFRYESESENARLKEVDTRTGLRWTNRATPADDGKTPWSF